jgi:hypothetical protein
MYEQSNSSSHLLGSSLLYICLYFLMPTTNESNDFTQQETSLIQPGGVCLSAGYILCGASALPKREMPNEEIALSNERLLT